MDLDAQLAERMVQYEDRMLVAILTIDSADYSDAAIKTAEAELARRGTPTDRLEEYSNYRHARLIASERASLDEIRATGMSPNDLQEQGQRNVDHGMMWVVGGILVSAVSYFVAPGGTFIIAWGAVFYGVRLASLGSNQKRKALLAMSLEGEAK